MTYITDMHSAVIIGAGFSGLCMAIKLKEKGIDDIIILEKAMEVGGTWRENTYPGAECDIPSALYSYSFEQYPHWKYKWSHQPQILDYLKHCAKKYDLYRHIIFDQTLSSAHWEGDHWVIETSSDDTYKTKSFVIAVGQLHHLNLPNIEGKEAFKGDSFHSAQWDHSVPLKDKTIGVIGNAASAVQFIPQIAKEAKEVVVYQRSANWMLPKQDRLYREWEKKLVGRLPILLRIYRLRLWLLGGGLFFLMKSGHNQLRKVYERKTIKYIKQYINDPDLVAALTPDYPMGARRILFSDDYYETLSQSHVRLENIPINQITNTGIVTTDGHLQELDLIVYGTGFKTNPFLSELDIIGKDKLSIREAWSNGPKNYLGMTVYGFPNMYLMYGPNTNLGHNSIIIMSEAQAKYISQCLSYIKNNKLTALEIRKEKFEEYYQGIQKRLDHMIWANIDKSWYKSANGDIPNNWPGRTMEYIRRTKKVAFDHYHMLRSS